MAEQCCNTPWWHLYQCKSPTLLWNPIKQPFLPHKLIPFFPSFLFFIAGCSISTLTIQDELLPETYTVAESPLSLKSTLQMKQGSQGHYALIRNTCYTSLVKAVMHSSSCRLTEDHSPLLCSIPASRHIFPSTLAPNNSCVTLSQGLTEHNAAEGQNLSTCSPQRATRENPKQRSNRVNFFSLLSSLYHEVGCNTAADLQIVPVPRDKQYSYTQLYYKVWHL